MKNIKEQLQLSRKTGTGIGKNSKFQEKANFKIAVKEGVCPYCDKQDGEMDTENIYETADTIKKTYEARPKYHWANFWVVDCVCNHCGKKYSQIDGF